VTTRRAKPDKTTFMKKGKVYLICPDCHIEQALRNEFGQDAYFLTALGSVFDFSEFDYAEALNHFINREMISEIIIVNDTNCTFIKNTICKENNCNTKAEQELKKLQKNNAEKFAPLDTNKQKELLTKLNIYRQAYELLDVAAIGGKVDDGLISVSGLIYNRDNSRFERLIL
jgi:carbonic anhydrase